VASWLLVTAAVKEANRQTPVLTNRNGIRGYKIWMSKHIIATSYKPWLCFIVDAAAIGGRKMLLPGEVSVAKAVEKSAEAIVGFGNELLEKGRGLTDKPKG